MGLLLYVIISVTALVILYYNRKINFLFILLIFLIIPPAELLYQYIRYQSDCLSSAGLTVDRKAENVAGFVYEGLSERCYACVARFLTKLGYRYVDIADNNNIGDIADVYYRFTLAETGAGACEDFEKAAGYLSPEALRTRFGLEPGQCIAREEIGENDTKYQLLKAERPTPAGNRHQFHKVRDRLSSERLAVSNAYLFGGGFLGWFWFFPGDAPYAACPAQGIALDGTSGDNLTKILVPPTKPAP
jgi:dolichol kinase